ncbi:Fruiting body protein SC3 [Leucoagaricus sp. SymC.cos]|nr:Fruiting body protein SC3 [Leucoagaricus sp. SymC.cos]
MFSKLPAILLAAVAIASAFPGDPPAGGSTSNTWNKTEEKCNVGELDCCQSLQKPSSKPQQEALSLISATLGDINALIGLNCNPITGIGASITGCSAQPACCSKNSARGREFDLVVEQTAVSVWVAGISGHAEVWKQASDPYPLFAPSITTFSPEPHIPIARFGRPSRLNKVTPPLVESQTVAQQLLQSDHEKAEADEIFAMISGLDACLISPTPTHERFSLPNASIAKVPPTFTRDHHVFSPISSPELSRPNSPYSSNSYSSSRESLTSISSTQSSVYSPLKASAKPFVRAFKIVTSAPRSSSIPCSSSIPPAQAPKSQVQRYLYQGGQSTVLTGGVMLGAAGKAPISRTPPTVGYKGRSSGS